MRWPLYCLFFFFFNDTATTEIYTLSLHDALPIYVDLEVPIVDLDLDVLRLGEHGDGDGRRVDPAARLGHRNALDTVDAALELEPAPRPAPVHEEDDVLEAARAGHAGIHDLDLPALALGVLRVHTRQLRGEQRGLLAACAGADLDEDVLLVVGIARQEQALQLVLERRLAGGEVVHLGLSELDELAVTALRKDVAAAPRPPPQPPGLRGTPPRLPPPPRAPAGARRLRPPREGGGGGQRPGGLVWP